MALPELNKFAERSKAPASFLVEPAVPNPVPLIPTAAPGITAPLEPAPTADPFPPVPMAPLNGPVVVLPVLKEPPPAPVVNELFKPVTPVEVVFAVEFLWFPDPSVVDPVKGVFAVVVDGVFATEGVFGLIFELGVEAGD